VLGLFKSSVEAAELKALRPCNLTPGAFVTHKSEAGVERQLEVAPLLYRDDENEEDDEEHAGFNTHDLILCRNGALALKLALTSFRRLVNIASCRWVTSSLVFPGYWIFWEVRVCNLLNVQLLGLPGWISLVLQLHFTWITGLSAHFALLRLAKFAIMSAYIEAMDFAVCRDLVLATFGYTAYLLFFQVFGGTKETVLDSPRYTWWVALSFQSVLFPVLCYLALQEIGASMPGATLAEKITAKWPAGARADSWPMVRLWLLSFFGYMTKDMVGVYKIGAVYIVHHIVCIYLAVSFLLLDLTPMIMIAGGTVAEIGSGCINVYYMGWTKGRPWLKYPLGTVMTVSNLIVIWLLVPFNKAVPPTGWTSPTFMLTVTVNLLCVERNRATLTTFSATETVIPGAKGKPDKVVVGPTTDIPVWFTLVGSAIGYYTVKYLAKQP